MWNLKKYTPKNRKFRNCPPSLYSKFLTEWWGVLIRHGGRGTVMVGSVSCIVKQIICLKMALNLLLWRPKMLKMFTLAPKAALKREKALQKKLRIRPKKKSIEFRAQRTVGDRAGLQPIDEGHSAQRTSRRVRFGFHSKRDRQHFEGRQANTQHKIPGKTSIQFFLVISADICEQIIQVLYFRIDVF